MNSQDGRRRDSNPGGDPHPSFSTQRRLLLAGTAGAAVVAGVAVAWLRPSRDAIDNDAVRQFWQLEFETPAGGKILTESLRGKPLLINFWATWCLPCIEELPMLDAFYREHSSKGLQVFGIAIDQSDSVRKFLERLPLAFPIAVAGMQGMTLARSFGNKAGGLPFSIMIGTEGSIEQRKLGTISLQDVAAWFVVPVRNVRSAQGQETK